MLQVNEILEVPDDPQENPSHGLHQTHGAASGGAAGPWPGGDQSGAGGYRAGPGVDQAGAGGDLAGAGEEKLGAREEKMEAGEEQSGARGDERGESGTDGGAKGPTGGDEGKGMKEAKSSGGQTTHLSVQTVPEVRIASSCIAQPSHLSQCTLFTLLLLALQADHVREMYTSGSSRCILTTLLLRPWSTKGQNLILHRSSL